MIGGIDPGISGALAILNDDLSLFWVVDLPTMALRGKKQQINSAELVRILKGVLEKNKLTIYLEFVSAMPGQGVTSMFNFGMCYGAIQGVLVAISIPMVLVSPQQWKARAGLKGKEKDMARTLAQQLYPAAPLGRKKDIGRADSILIARFSC